ncbi:hypothetical protein [Nonomuraea cavernae]|uniref:DivIVA domain-containing protein n=1 Tax=Nonomuraea cavernae TaxID=2045107 RepID=A0A917YXY6_9ACTN|nr:hypothetical protein [Nonomuraea cavernae]MCA2186708.1 hypothetical protein [Nonomuraea cavernae]GGO67823.1 hypothetical protein GCM10012289_25210 [Nonomuraea cavernae]
MLVILAIAALAILACVVLVSLGRGGELTEFPPDVPPLDLPEPGQLTAVDFMALHLPVNIVGYHTQSVDETLRRAANAISARDTRIAVLEQRVSELLSSRLHARQEVYAAPGGGLRTDHEPEAPAASMELPEAGDPVPSLDTAALAPFATGSELPFATGSELPVPNGVERRGPEAVRADDLPDTQADIPASQADIPAAQADTPAARADIPADTKDAPDGEAGRDGDDSHGSGPGGGTPRE